MRRSVILLVEDNSRDETLTLRALKKSGINDEIIVMHDGAEALDFLFGDNAADDRPGPMPTLVLLDLNLPKIGGLDVLRRLRGDPKTRLLPVVILTSSDEDKDVVKSYQFGANSYVRKPVEYNEFANAVQQLGHYWLLLNRSVAPDEIHHAG